MWNTRKARRVYRRDHSKIERRTATNGDVVKVRMFSGPGFRTWARKQFSVADCAGKLAHLVGGA